MTLEEITALNARIDELQARVNALITRLDSMLANEPEDPTQRILPIPGHMLPHLPPCPEGKTEWVGRGEFGGNSLKANDRTVFWFSPAAFEFVPTRIFSRELFHIEAV
jgi:hypothetical protein